MEFGENSASPQLALPARRSQPTTECGTAPRYITCAGGPSQTRSRFQVDMAQATVNPSRPNPARSPWRQFERHLPERACSAPLQHLQPCRTLELQVVRSWSPSVPVLVLAREARAAAPTWRPSNQRCSDARGRRLQWPGMNVTGTGWFAASSARDERCSISATLADATWASRVAAR